MVNRNSSAGKVSRLARTERSPVNRSDFAAEIFNLSQATEAANILVYGDSNVGKTVLAGTAPGKTFWLVGEPGYKTANQSGVRGHGRVISDTATAWAAVEWLETGDRASRLDWLVLDGSTTMQDRFRLSYAAEAFDVNPTSRQHRNLPDRPDYFNTQNMLKAWIPRLVDLPCNLLITAHAYRTDKTENGELLVFPGFQGKVMEVANAISGLMDVTAYFEKKRLRSRQDPSKSKLVRRLWFESPDTDDDVRYICGDKFNALGQYMDFPTIPKMLEKINGGTNA